MRTLCKTRFRDLVGVWVKDSVWDQFINQARRELVTLVPWLAVHEGTALVATVAGVRQLIPPNNVGEYATIRGIYDIENAVPLEAFSNLESVYNRYPTWATEQARPAAYMVEGPNALLAPVPDASYTLEVFFTKNLNDLAGLDIPPEPPQCHDAYVEGALSRAHADSEDLRMSDHHRSRFAEMVKTIRDFEPHNREEGYPSTVDDMFVDRYL